VDSKQFDELVARLASGPSRRDTLKGLVGGTLAAVGVTSVAEGKGRGKAKSDKKGRKRRGGAHAEACIPTGKKCPSKKPRGRKRKTLGCDRCCQGFSVPGKSGRIKCACKPDGFSCTTATASDCCSAFCSGGTCQPYGA
jgi:hypothetical protein